MAIGACLDFAFRVDLVWLIAGKSPAGVTPTAKRNTYSVAILVGVLPRGSVLSPATQGYVITTPLPFRGALRHAGDRWFRVAKVAYHPPWATPSLYAHNTSWANIIPPLGAYHPSWLANYCPNMFDHSYRKTVRTPGNSVGVAIPQPRVEVRSASTLGIHTKKKCNAVSVALSRRLLLTAGNANTFGF